ncbi:MAG TPA: hypothetical protein VI548_08885 [Chitinophagaceae bacterium]|nr:hypothetical protein [Chitinophagaceae bacterium]
MFKQIKKKLMKKLFGILAIAALVSCNSGDSTTEETTSDTTVTVIPSTDTVTTVTDTTIKVTTDTTKAQ